MTPINVKTLLFISSTDKIYSNSFLIHCAKYWADQGNKVLYITHQPVEHLPHSVGAPRTSQSLENFCLIRFMYLPGWEDLLKYCYSIHYQQSPVSVIIVQELETYFVTNTQEDHDHVSLVCASLLYAASVCAAKNSKPAHLIAGFNSVNSTMPRTISKSFFHNIWQLSRDQEETENGEHRLLIKLSNLSRFLRTGDVKLFVFCENDEEKFLDFKSAFEAVVEGVR